MWVLFSTILLYTSIKSITRSVTCPHISGNFFIFYFFVHSLESKRDTRDLYFLVCSKLIVFLIFQSLWDQNKNNPSQSNFIYNRIRIHKMYKNYVVSSTINIYLYIVEPTKKKSIFNTKVLYLQTLT